MAKAQDGSGPISEESIGYLEDVKKGKPRKFAMICKGTTVVSLVVYKKGNVEKRRKEAKESGKGQFYFGVVDGKGMDIRRVWHCQLRVPLAMPVRTKEVILYKTG